MQKRFVNAAVTLGLYIRGSNADSPIQDCFEALLRMNDNDIHNARSYKTKKLRQLNADELAEVFETDQIHRFSFVDEDSGILYDYDNLFLRHSQEGGAPDDD